MALPELRAQPRQQLKVGVQLRAAVCTVPEAADAADGIGGRGGEVVGTAAGVGFQVEEALVLLLQRRQQREQRHVLVHVREVAGVEAVAVFHDPRAPAARRRVRLLQAPRAAVASPRRPGAWRRRPWGLPTWPWRAPCAPRVPGPAPSGAPAAVPRRPASRPTWQPSRRPSVRGPGRRPVPRPPHSSPRPSCPWPAGSPLPRRWRRRRRWLLAAPAAEAATALGRRRDQGDRTPRG